MYALIYDEHLLDKPKKMVISTRQSREEAETALEHRRNELGRTITDCNTRIVWIEGEVTAGEYVTPGDFDAWRPGETVPEGELYSDED